MKKMQVVVTLEHEGRKITATRFAVDGMIANPIPDADAKRKSIERAMEPLRQRRAVIEAEIAYLDAQEWLTVREAQRRKLAPAEEEALSAQIRDLNWELQVYAQFVPLSKFTTDRASWKVITPKPAQTNRRAA